MFCVHTFLCACIGLSLNLRNRIFVEWGNIAGEEVGGVALLVVQEKPNFSFKDEGSLHDTNPSTIYCFLCAVDCAFLPIGALASSLCLMEFDLIIIWTLLGAVEGFSS